MNILLVEDDYQQSESIEMQLSSKLENVTITTIDTESDFRQLINSIESNPPDIILLDIMLRWANPSEHIEKEPKDVEEGGFFKAGFRCQSLLSQNKKTAKIPVILYSVLDKMDLASDLRNLPKNVIHIAKDRDISPLIMLMKKHVYQKGYN